MSDDWGKEIWGLREREQPWRRKKRKGRQRKGGHGKYYNGKMQQLQ
jgi:hypothetical protein